MKRKSIITLAVVAGITSTAFAGFNAPLPEFKTPKQLAEWRAEMAAKAEPKTTATQDTAFYTGKPYLVSSGNYAFKYRSYNSELARWTSEDPSGFPDGANSNIYKPSPTSELDPLGLVKTPIVTGVPQSGISGNHFGITSTYFPQRVPGIIQATMGVEWNVSSGLKGYVVQYLQFEEGVSNDDGSPWTSVDPMPLTSYWEAFRIDGTKSIVIDNWLTPFYEKTTHGTFKVTGKVDFYQDNCIPSNSPTTWLTDNPLTHGLPSTYTQPSWWTGTGFNHNLTMTWE